MTIALTSAFAMIAPGISLAQAPAPTRGLPANVVTSTTPNDQTIRDYLTAAVTDLKNPDPAKQQAGRDAIVNFAAANTQPSPSFVTAYSRLLNTQLQGVTSAPDLRTRLNAAVAAAKIAEKIDNDTLTPTITALLNDKSEAVAIWAMKAAKSVTPRTPGGPTLLQPIVDSGKRFPSSATNAYQALIGAAPPNGEPVPSSAAIDAIHKLMEARSAFYKDGVPPDPLAEFVAMNQLVNSKWWQAQGPAQQQKTIQLLVNLAFVAGQRVQGNVSQDDRESMALLVRQISRAFQAIAELTGKPPALKKKLEAAALGVGKTSTPEQTNTAANAVITAVRAEFPAVTTPAPLPATKPSPTTK